MTEQEAMEIIMQVAYDGEFPLNSNEAFGIACKCIEKQIPKKPKKVIKMDIIVDYDNVINTRRGLCGNCIHMITEAYDNFCPRCGQKIEWEEVEE